MGQANCCFDYMKVRMILNLFRLTSKREVVTALLKYNCYDYYFQVSLLNATVWIILWILTLF